MKSKYIKIIIFSMLALFILMNGIAFSHAYKFTHFIPNTGTKTESGDKLAASEKLFVLLFGINNPRPANKCMPEQDYETINLQSDKLIECWHIPVPDSKGTVILFHGYGGEKSSMLDKSNEFLHLGYSTLLVDFQGSGSSEGNQTTIGFKEAENVKTSFDYLIDSGEKNIFLFGTSMGSAAILKAINDHQIDPKGIMIECPFGSMYETVCARFSIMNVPSFPMAGLLMFWGGIQNGFNAFSHQPTEYAKSVHCPTLLMYGENDRSVSRSETDEIYSNLAGFKKLILFPDAKHENYLNKYKNEWINEVGMFLSEQE